MLLLILIAVITPIFPFVPNFHAKVAIEAGINAGMYDIVRPDLTIENDTTLEIIFTGITKYRCYTNFGGTSEMTKRFFPLMVSGIESTNSISTLISDPTSF